MIAFLATLATFAIVFILRNLPGRSYTMPETELCVATLPTVAIHETIGGDGWILVRRFGSNGAVIQLDDDRKVSIFLKKGQTIANAASALVNEIKAIASKKAMKIDEAQFQLWHDLDRFLSTTIIGRGMQFGMNPYDVAQAIGKARGGDEQAMQFLLPSMEHVSAIGMPLAALLTGKLSHMSRIERGMCAHGRAQLEQLAA